MTRRVAETVTSALRVILCFFAFSITLVSLVFTVTTDYAESAFFYELGQGIFVFSLTGLLALVLSHLISCCGSLKRSHFFAFVAVVSFILSAIWVFSSRAIPDFDSFDLIGASRLDTLSGWWIEGGYLERYPFQVPFVLVLALLRLFVESDTAINGIFQIVNCISISCCTILLICLAEAITPCNQNKVRMFSGALVLLFPPLYLYATFVYGNLIALPFALGAFLLQIKGFASHRAYLHFASGLCAAIAVLLKSSMLLVIVAQCVVWFVSAIKHRSATYFFALLFAVVLYKILSSLVLVATDLVMDIDLHNGIPQTAWLVMGIGADAQGEAMFSTAKPGWYSGYPWVLPAEQYDPNIVSDQSISLIKDRLLFFIQNPVFSVRFFIKKFVYEWAEPTFESIMMSNWSVAGPAGVAMATREMGALAKSVYYGTAGNVLKVLCDVSQLIIYLGSLVTFIKYSKNMPIEIMAPALCAAGGGLFYLFWEAKSQYILPFALFLVPYAAIGVVAITEKRLQSNLAK